MQRFLQRRKAAASDAKSSAARAYDVREHLLSPAEACEAVGARVDLQNIAASPGLTKEEVCDVCVCVCA
jgi:hypothetical protein